MKGIFSYNHAQKTIAQVSFPDLVKYHANERDRSLRQLSEILGMSQSFLSRHLNAPTIDVTLVYALSYILNVNLFQPFQNLLPQHIIAATPREEALTQQIATLQQEIATLQREKELLEKIVVAGK